MIHSPPSQDQNRLALIGIIVDEPSSVATLNDLLHQYSPWIVGRMGLPYKERQVSVISIVVDAPSNIISTLSGKLGMLKGVKAKTLHAKV